MASRNDLDPRASWFLRSPILMPVSSFSFCFHLNLQLVSSSRGRMGRRERGGEENGCLKRPLYCHCFQELLVPAAHISSVSTPSLSSFHLCILQLHKKCCLESTNQSTSGHSSSSQLSAQGPPFRGFSPLLLPSLHQQTSLSTWTLVLTFLSPQTTGSTETKAQDASGLSSLHWPYTVFLREQGCSLNISCQSVLL